MREVTSIGAADDVLWVGTTGGVFRYDPSSGEIRRYTIADGLHGIQVRAIAVDSNCVGGRTCIWIGYQDGVLDRLDPETGAVNSYRDIERADRFARREINRMVVRGDSLLVATSFGLVVFDAQRTEVRDSYTQFNTLDSGIPVYDVAVGATDDDAVRIWVATEAGVAHACAGLPYISSPARGGGWEAAKLRSPNPHTPASQPTVTFHAFKSLI